MQTAGQNRIEGAAAEILRQTMFIMKLSTPFYTQILALILLLIRSLLISPYKFYESQFCCIISLAVISCLYNEQLHMHIVLKSFLFSLVHIRYIYHEFMIMINSSCCRSCCKISLIIDNVKLKHWNVEIVAETGGYMR